MIRKAKKEDLENIYKCFLEFRDEEDKNAFKIGGEDSIAYTKRKKNFEKASKEELLDQIESKDSTFLVFTDENEIQGYCFGIVEKPESKTHELPNKSGWFDTLVVRKKSRGKGIGKQLCEKLESYFKKEGCHDINLSFFASNSVEKLYENLGYKRTVIKMNKKL